MAGSPDDDLDGLRAARPAQDDPIARRLEARVRAALTGAEVAPARIDRFVVEGQLGAGGMGVVYAAFDPRLDRKVAIKVLHARDDRARARVLAEARALARLSHPNVVAVHDASADGDELTITMELVDGANLRRWLAAGARDVPLVLAVIGAAGRGLAAAHAAGLVHGDVKPENILVGGGLVVKVADFGLARADGADAGTAVGGTPAYLAPEVARGGVPDATSDQYSLAVTAYEALAGIRPAVPPAPLPRGIPARVDRALRRALSPDPAARFPSVAALVDALSPGDVPRAAIALAVAAPLVVAAGVLAFVVTRHGAPACTGGEDQVEAVLPHEVAAQFWPKVTVALDHYTAAWSEQRRLACAATRDGDQSAALLDRRMACLDRRLAAVGALVQALRATPAPTFDDAVDAAYALPPLEPCANRDQLLAIEPPAPAIRAQADALAKRTAGAAARIKLDYRAGLAEATAIVAEARSLGYAPVLADALVVLGKLQLHASDGAAADATFKEAIDAATTARDDSDIAEAWSGRVYVAGFLQGKLREALAYAEAADAAAARMSSPSVAHAVIKTYAGQLLAQTDKLPEARAAVEQAAAILAEVRGKDHPQYAETLSALADIALAQGDFAAARDYADRAMAIFQKLYGPNHEDVAVVANTIANIAFEQGDFTTALDGYRAVLDMDISTLGELHINTAIAHANVGDVLRRLGHDDEARAQLATARDIYTQTIGLGTEEGIKVLVGLAKLEPDPVKRTALLEDVLARRTALYGESNRTIADTLDDLGNAAVDAGQLDRAAELYQRAIAVFEQTLGPGDPHITVPLSNAGELAIKRGKFGDAITACERALAIDTAALGADHPDLAYDLTCLGEARLGQHDAAGALPVLERANALRVDGSAPPDEIERTHRDLARAQKASAAASGRHGPAR